MDDSNYESWTQSSKRKDKRKDDVSIDTTIDNDTIDNDTSNKNMTWNKHDLHSNYGTINDLQQIDYRDGDYKIDITVSVTLVDKMNKYQSYKDAYNNNTITHNNTPPPVSSEYQFLSVQRLSFEIQVPL